MSDVAVDVVGVENEDGVDVEGEGVDDEDVDDEDVDGKDIDDEDPVDNDDGNDGGVGAIVVKKPDGKVVVVVDSTPVAVISIDDAPSPVGDAIVVVVDIGSHDAF